VRVMVAVPCESALTRVKRLPGDVPYRNWVTSVEPFAVNTKVPDWPYPPVGAGGFSGYSAEETVGVFGGVLSMVKGHATLHAE